MSVAKVSNFIIPNLGGNFIIGFKPKPNLIILSEVFLDTIADRAEQNSV